MMHRSTRIFEECGCILNRLQSKAMFCVVRTATLQSTNNKQCELISPQS